MTINSEESPSSELRHRDPGGFEVRDTARKEAASNIDPATAEVWWEYAQIMDPYGEFEELCEGVIGRVWFVMDSVERVPVALYDMPKASKTMLERLIYPEATRKTDSGVAPF